jgi:hypothetical protein
LSSLERERETGNRAKSLLEKIQKKKARKLLLFPLGDDIVRIFPLLLLPSILKKKKKKKPVRDSSILYWRHLFLTSRLLFFEVVFVVVFSGKEESSVLMIQNEMTQH